MQFEFVYKAWDYCKLQATFNNVILSINKNVCDGFIDDFITVLGNKIYLHYFNY